MAPPQPYGYGMSDVDNVLCPFFASAGGGAPVVFTAPTAFAAASPALGTLATLGAPAALGGGAPVQALGQGAPLGQAAPNPQDQSTYGAFLVPDLKKLVQARGGKVKGLKKAELVQVLQPAAPFSPAAPTLRECTLTVLSRSVSARSLSYRVASACWRTTS